MYIYIYIYNLSAVLHAELLKNRKTGMQSQTVPGILWAYFSNFLSFSKSSEKLSQGNVPLPPLPQFYAYAGKPFVGWVG